MAGLSTANRLTRYGLALVVLLSGLTLLAGYANKARCTGPEFDEYGRSGPMYKERIDGDVCYSDIQHLWLGRDIDKHVFPYLQGSLNEYGQPEGGTVEYPVLTGVVIWAGAIFAHNDAEFLLGSALVMAPFGLLTAWMLGGLSRWRALVWALGPPVVLYAFHNWDLPVVLCAVAAVYVVHRGWGRRGAHRPLADRALVASVLLALGFAFKIYPGVFVLPLLLYVLTGGTGGRELPASVRRAGRRLDPAGALRVAFAAVVTVVLVNLPFMLLGFEGWRASFEFQGNRKVDLTTNSIWYWGFRPWSNPDNGAFQAAMDVLSPTLMLASFALACWLGWRRFQREGTYPWIAVSAAMLCGFLLLHKVHSPQYTLWLLPFFVLMRVRWQWIAAYFVADLAMGIGIFRWYYITTWGLPPTIYDGFAPQAVMIGVWGRAALLLALFFVFLNSRSTVDGEPAPRPLRRGPVPGRTPAPAVASTGAGADDGVRAEAGEGGAGGGADQEDVR
ncbi:glycosyltransferase family 87 protein [Actinoalloteichus spitiensis]|uniref:glycosyltransferase family 87 protein n=1 Tax=Actinoalloteichus spitiensis TaxID=252394 RepID=UPI003CCAFB56